MAKYVRINIFLVATILVLFLSCGSGYAEPVQIVDIADQKVDGGTTYTFVPRLAGTNDVLWHKLYGPDELKVDPFTGSVKWEIPRDFDEQSLHIGVAASDGRNRDEVTWVLTIGRGDVTYLDSGGMLDKALFKLKPGGTLIIRNGVIDTSIVYQRIDSRKRIDPPSGRPGAFTTIIAEDPGKVIMDVSGADAFGMHLVGSKYIKIAGLVIKDAGRIGLSLLETNHIYLKDIGIYDSGRALNSYNHQVANLNIISSSDFLVEGLYSFGHSRYKAQFTQSERGIIRRSIARIDHYAGSNPIGGFQSYCSKDITYENNIVIDSNTSEFWYRFKNHQNAFGVIATECLDRPTGNVFIGNIVLNSHTGAMQTDAAKAPSPTVWTDLVAWDLALDRYNAGEGHPTPLMHAVGLSKAEFVTAGKVRVNRSTNREETRYFYSRSAPSVVQNSFLLDFAAPGYLAWANDPDLTVKDSVIQNISATKSGGDESHFTRVDSTNVQLRYLPRAPDQLAKTCSGNRCGANIMFYSGAQGTFWGDPGYDSLSSTQIWPIATQNRIAYHMRQYEYIGRSRSGHESRLTGDRGFARETTDLTSYIWGYLDNPVPPFLAFARQTSSGVELAWLPVNDDRVEKYRVYSIDNGRANLLGTVENDQKVRKYQVEQGASRGPYRVVSVFRDGNEGEYGYDVELKD